MEVAQVVAHHRGEEAHAVVVGIGIEAGVEPGGRGNAQMLGCAYGRPAQWAFGGHVDRVGAQACPALAQRAARRQSKAQAGIAGKGSATHFERDDAGFIFEGLPLAGTNQVDRVALRREPGGEAVHGQCHAVDFGWIGFADYADAHLNIPFAGPAQPAL